MKKLIGLVSGLGKGLVRPLPLSGVLTTIKEVKESKFALEKVLKLAAYVLVGIALWALILGKITINDVVGLINALGL